MVRFYFIYDYLIFLHNFLDVAPFSSGKKGRFSTRNSREFVTERGA